MIYPYRCKACTQEFDVVKSIAEIDNAEKCLRCGSPDVERFISPSIHFNGAKVEDAEYNPALGKVVKSAKHRKELAKQMGLEEIGNESVETVHKHYESQKAKQLDDAWEKV